MIRETLPDCGGQVSERAVGMYRMWHCFDCGLDFSMKTLQEPEICPICLVPRGQEPEEVRLVKENELLRRKVKFLEGARK